MVLDMHVVGFRILNKESDFNTGSTHSILKCRPSISPFLPSLHTGKLSVFLLYLEQSLRPGLL